MGTPLARSSDDGDDRLQHQKHGSPQFSPAVSLGSKDTADCDEDIGSYDYNDSFIASEGSVEPSAASTRTAGNNGSESGGRASVMSPAPKPPTTWQTFCKEERHVSRAALGGNAPHAEVMRHLGVRWKAMSTEERAAYAAQ